jgi:MFS family permease
VGGALSMSLLGDKVRRSRTAIAGLVAISGGVLLLGTTRQYGVGLAAMFLMGIGYVHVTVSLNTSIQMRVAETYRGRVLAIYLMGLLVGVPIGALAIGAISDPLGLRPTTIACGAALLAVTVFTVVRFRGLAPLDEALEDEFVGIG